MQLIGITGKMGTGKSSAAEVFEKYGYARKSFATPLKHLARTYFFWDEKKDERGRQLLQTLGTEAGRTYDKDLWVKHMAKSIEASMKVMQNNNQDCKIVTDDIRFDNEAQLIRDLGGIVIHLASEGYNMGELNNHESEKGVEFNHKDILLTYPKFNDKEEFQEIFEGDMLEIGLLSLNGGKSSQNKYEG